MVRLSSLSVVVWLALISGPASASVFPLVNNFNTNPLGELPPGWAFHTGFNSQTYVAVDPVNPNNRVLQIDENPTDGQNWVLRNTFTPFTLDAGSGTLFYQFRLYVESIAGNNSEGFQFQIFSPLSQIDAGKARVLRVGSAWELYNGLFSFNSAVPSSAYSAPFNMNQWYTFRVEFDPVSASAGEVRWYIDGQLISTETYTGRSLSQTQNIQIFEISNFNLGVGGARMYLDDLIIGIPEPSGATLLLLTGAILLRRRPVISKGQSIHPS